MSQTRPETENMHRICALCAIQGEQSQIIKGRPADLRDVADKGGEPRICIGSAPSAQSTGEQSQIIKGMPADLRDAADKAGNQGYA
jgi:hypothetical protein